MIKMQSDLFNITKSDAVFCKDRIYRYGLWRIWNEKLPKVLFIGLNPSTATETKTTQQLEDVLDTLGIGDMVDTLWEIFLLIVLLILS